MSSLLQFKGNTKGGKVGLQFYRTAKQENDKVPLLCEPTEQVPCAICGKSHPRLWIAYRRPVGMCGCWVVFRYLGTEHVPDLSLPIPTFDIPKGAVKSTDKENANLWHS